VTGEPSSGPEIVHIEGLACGQAVDGTGFVAGRVVITNAHVVAGATELTVIDERGNASPAVIVAFDPTADLAALRAQGGIVVPRSVRFADAVAGDTGSVAEQTFEVRRRVRAHIADIYGEGEVVRPSLEIEADIVRGDSGAPLVDGNGAVVGVVYASSRGKLDTAYAIRATAVGEFLDGLTDAPSAGGPCR
jgi:S1-C subfamily serine protease